MVRAGLGDQWRCLLANDFDSKKGESYSKNWGEKSLIVDDIRKIKTEDIVSRAAAAADLAWASFPCQDLSLAGGGAGLKGERSGTFWPFWEHMQRIRSVGLAPRIIALENVCGTLTSHGGNDFKSIYEALQNLGYRVGAVVLDAAKFLPQSRPRLFILCIRQDQQIPNELLAPGPDSAIHSRALCSAHAKLDTENNDWIWWRLPNPKAKRKTLKSLIDTDSDHLEWNSFRETQALISMMNEINRDKLRKAKNCGKVVVGTMYRRTRYETGKGKVQRVEVRFDGLAGCLRTPAGGSSRQMIIAVDGQKVRTRLMSARETARLMGLDRNYILPENFNDALHLTGDGVAVPVVRYLASSVFEPIIFANRFAADMAA